jgi:hypothetical protein
MVPMSNVLNYSSQGFPMRRFLSGGAGGSVADRVLLFERSPALFGIGTGAAIAAAAAAAAASSSANINEKEMRIPIQVLQQQEKRPTTLSATASLSVTPTTSLMSSRPSMPTAMAPSPTPLLAAVPSPKQEMTSWNRRSSSNESQVGTEKDGIK